MSQPPILSSYTDAAPDGTVLTKRGVANGHANGQLNGHANGHANGQVASTKQANKPAVAPIDWEIPRKALHSSIGFLSLWLWTSHGSPTRVIVALSSSLAIIIPADVLRLNSPGFERVYERMLGFLMRESEKKSSNGVIWFMFGAIYVLALFPLDIAVVSIVILSWADTAASTFGRLWGRYTPPLPRRLPLLGLPFAPRKSLAGFIAACITGALVAIGFWGLMAPLGAPDQRLSWTWKEGFRMVLSPSIEAIAEQIGVKGVINTGGWVGLAIIGLFAGLVSGVAEALDLGSLDDNLTLPIISGTCIWAFFSLLSHVSA